MKRLLICGIAATAFFSANAQVDFGVKAGLNISNFSGSDASGSKAKAGFFAGVASDIKLSDELHLKPELVYSLQGAKGDGSTGSASINANYLNLPIMLAYQFKQGLFIQTGPQIGFLLSANATINGQSGSVKDAFTKTDFSWGFGAGYKVAENIAVDLRYNLGLSKIATGGANSHNTVIQVGVAYYFNNK